MAAINLLINENIISYEIRDNVIILKKNGTIVYEFPIPTGYYLAGTIDKNQGKIKEKKFVITNYELTPPSFVPIGFGEPYLSDSGVWKIEKNDDKSKKMDYIDTSVVDLESIYDVYCDNERAKELFTQGFKIPKSFWYSFDFHHSYRNATKIIDIPNLMKDFDSRARLIREEEAMTLIALDSSHHLSKGIEKNLFNLGKDSSIVRNEYAINCRGHIPDNWPILASSIENQNVYRTLTPQLFFECDDTYESNACITISYDKPYPYLIFPVIDEESTKKRTLKK